MPRSRQSPARAPAQEAVEPGVWGPVQVRAVQAQGWVPLVVPVSGPPEAGV